MANEPIQGLPYPDPSEPPAGPAQIKALADAVVTRTNMRFATTGARDAVITAPVAGMECYIGSGATAIKQIYHAGSWTKSWEVNATGSLTPASGYTAPVALTWRRINDTLWLTGAVTRTAGGLTGTTFETITTLPAGCRPLSAGRWLLSGNGTNANQASAICLVGTDGVVQVVRGDGPAGAATSATLYLAPISFPLI